MGEWTRALSFEHPRVDIVGSDLSYNFRFDLNTGDRFFAPCLNYSISFDLLFTSNPTKNWYAQSFLFLKTSAEQTQRLFYSFIVLNARIQTKIYNIAFSFKLYPLKSRLAHSSRQRHFVYGTNTAALYIMQRKYNFDNNSYKDYICLFKTVLCYKELNVDASIIM